jgi:pimeloyl-ACP methyl ester carboxylesterase
MTPPDISNHKPASQVSERRGPGLRAALAYALRIAVLVFVGILVVLYSLQDQVIFPGASTQGTPEATVHLAAGAELITLETPRADKVTALFGAALSPAGGPLDDPMSRPALLYFYGNAMCLAYAEQEFDRFRRLGLNVMIPDYVGYGLSTGKPSEIGCRQTAEVCLEHLRSRGFPSSKIIVAGWSLGGAVAIDAASRHSFGGLIAFSTFTSSHDMARHLIPVPLPRFFLAHQFDSLKKIPSIKCPILLGHGRRDNIVPFSMFERLAGAAKAPLTQLVIDEAEHNDYYDVGGNEIDRAITSFVDQLRK